MITLSIITLASCTNQHEQQLPQTNPVEENPFLTEYKTPFQVPPFDKIENSHYLPAFEAGIAQQQA